VNLGAIENWREIPTTASHTARFAGLGPERNEAWRTATRLRAIETFSRLPTTSLPNVPAFVVAKPSP